MVVYRAMKMPGIRAMKGPAKCARLRSRAILRRSAASPLTRLTQSGRSESTAAIVAEIDERIGSGGDSQGIDLLPSAAGLVTKRKFDRAKER